MTDPADLVNRVYAAFNRRDIDAVLEAMHPAVDWPNGWEGGRLMGREAMRDYWTRQWASIDPIVVPEAIHPLPDGRIAVCVRQTVRTLEGLVMSRALIGHVYTLEDGLLRAMDIVPEG